MFSWTALLAPIALLLPPAADIPAQTAALSGKNEAAAVQAGTAPREWTAFQPWQPQANPMQVRIQQRVVIRVSPARPRNNALLANLPRQFPDRLAERKMGDCVAMDGVAGVQTGGPSKLILYMRDRRMISAELEKACSARDFYSGFYVETSKDGNLCINRDKLQSRTGTKCELSKFRRLIAVKD